MDITMTDADLGATPLTFDVWVAPRLPALMRFAYLVTGSQQSAEDAVQSALTTVCARWRRISRADDPDVYVRRMVVNAHISAWRRSGRREVVVDVVRDRTVPDAADVLARDDAVWRACLSLAPQQRAAVVLRFYEDLDYPEIARLLDVAEATVRSHVHRGLAALRTQLTDQPDQEKS